MPQTVNLQFPLGGLSEHEPFQRPDGGRTPDALNVMPFDSIDDRARGGSRAGSSLYFNDQVNGSNTVQCVVAGVIAAGNTDLVPVGGALVDLDFTTASTGDVATVFPTHFPTDGSMSTGANGYYPLESLNSTTALQVIDFGGYAAADQIGIAVSREDLASSVNAGAAFDSALGLGSTFLLQADVTLQSSGTAGAGWERSGVGFFIRADTANYSSNVGYGVLLERKAQAAGTTYRVRVCDWSDTTVGNYVAESSDFTIATRSTGAIHWSEVVEMKLAVNGSELEVFINGVSRLSYTMTSFGGNGGVGITQGFLTNTTGNHYGAMLNLKAWAATARSSARRFRIAAACGGSAYIADPGDTAMTLAANGSAVFGSGVPVRATEAFGYLYFVDGSYTGYRRIQISDGVMSGWVSDLTGGLLPTDGGSSEGGTIICTYRGRVVIAGLQSDPQNWFMSRQGDPLDWNYGGTIDGQEPVAGDQGTAVGKVGDIITAMAPWSDDVLVFGGDHTLSMMSGDPAAGGRIDTISNQIGVVGPDAWAHDPFGNLHFVGNDGHYRMPSGGGQPECLSRGRLDKTFRDTDYALNRPILVWDRERIGLWIFFARSDAIVATPLFWDQRTDSYWPQQFPQNQGPFCSLLFDADKPNDRAILLGGNDGYVYQLDSSAGDDNGTAISSYVVFPPIVVGDQARVNVLQTGLILDDGGSATLSLKAYSGRYAAQAVDRAVAITGPRFERTISEGGRQINFMNRVSGHAVCYRLATDTDGGSWAMESASPAIDPAGLARRTR